MQLDNDSLATWPNDVRWYTSGLQVRRGREAGGHTLAGRVADAVRAMASAGALVRWGAPPEGPTWPGEPVADWGGSPEGSGRWHVYAGADLRAVAMDRLIDGPAFGQAPAVRVEP